MRLDLIQGIGEVGEAADFEDHTLRCVLDPLLVTRRAEESCQALTAACLGGQLSELSLQHAHNRLSHVLGQLCVDC